MSKHICEGNCGTEPCSEMPIHRDLGGGRGARTVRSARRGVAGHSVVAGPITSAGGVTLRLTPEQIAVLRPHDDADLTSQVQGLVDAAIERRRLDPWRRHCDNLNAHRPCVEGCHWCAAVKL